MKTAGFFKINKVERCNDPEHDPPSFLHIPQGQGYNHICPKCGKVTTLIPPQITL